MKMSGGPASIYIKVILICIALLISLGTLIYTRTLVSQLQSKDKQVVELYAKGMEYVANNNNPNSDLTFIFENIIKPIDFPLILTDSEDNISVDNPAGYRNIKLDSTLSAQEKKNYLIAKIKELDEINPPIPITYADTLVLGKIHYGDSNLISQLRYYPYFQIFFAAMFILIGYISFSYIKRHEQSNIWVGMAKETAHQLGTPLSSLMGWSEILKLSASDPDKVLDIAQEIDNDLSRLNKITQRFSKIGSKPELKLLNVQDEIQKTIEYFKRRLPQSGRNVVLQIKAAENVKANLNPELFGWVLENLIKNALDAIEAKQGEINFYVIDGKKYVEIDVQDNGKGIAIKRRKDVFRPGYSTKKRGWGLGLSLSRRIIEGYHKGRIYVKSSSPEGTIFKIMLPR